MTELPRRDFTSDPKSDQNPGETTNLRRELLTLLVIAALSLGLALFLKLCVAQAYEIRGRSMEPTLHDGDRVILLKLAPDILPIERGDLIIFAHPRQPDRDLVKRVIAIGGDRVHITHGKIYVNGRLSPYSLYTRCHHAGENEWDVPEGAYFVLGDNRANSQDSRDFGCVAHDLVKGKVWFRWWPLGGD